MPTYSHICNNEECKNEWEDFYSIMKDPPTICPKCNQETAQRTIDGGVDKGIVRLTGQDLVDKTKADAVQLEKSLYKDANKYANFLGESKYESIQRQLDQNKRNR